MFGPNIMGNFQMERPLIRRAGEAFSTSYIGSYRYSFTGSYDTSFTDYVTFAARSSNIAYGNSTTVQAPSVLALLIVKT